MVLADFGSKNPRRDVCMDCVDHVGQIYFRGLMLIVTQEDFAIDKLSFKIQVCGETNS